MLKRGADLAAQHRHFEYFFFPHTDAVLIKYLDETSDPPTRAGLGRWFTDTVGENWLFRLASARCRAKPERCPAVNQRIVRRLRESNVVDRGHRVLSTKRNVRFNEMEYALPAEHGAVCMAELAKWIARDRIGVHFPIEFRYVKGDEIPLSPCFGRDSVTISIHQYVGMEYDGYFRGAEKIFLEYGGRPHWGKLHYLSGAELRTRYPRWEEFHRVRRQLDPKGVFMAPYLRKILLDSS
jgi:L-gulonolactone oxidase